MKTQMVWKWCLGLAMTALPFAGGCLPEASPPPPVSSAVIAPVGAPAPAESTAVAAPTVSTNLLSSTNDVVDAPATPVSTEKPVPANLRPTVPVSEVIKLANSGVDDSVLLAYVTNSPSTFNLGADEIIYLNDIGVPGPVVTAMIQHDQQLKTQLAAAAAQASAPAPQPAPVAQAGPQPLPEAPTSAPQSEAAAPTYAPAPTAPGGDVSYSSFYSSLAPYGTWVDIEGYGRCWQPSVVVINPTWRPYVDNGYWLYSDAGWYWYSDYSWGWAPFHYGRWFRHAHLGWCWYPDTVWGPSWVSWRYDDAYCGWAPLPPAAYYRPGFGFSYYGSSVGFGFDFGLGWDCFAFVGWNNFHHHHLHECVEPPHHVRDFYHKTIPVNRIEDTNHRVVNSGIPRDRVASLTHTEVRRVAIRDMGTEAPRGGRRERLDPTAKTVSVYRPQLPPSTGPAPAVAGGPAGGVRGERTSPTRQSPALGQAGQRPAAGSASSTLAPATSGGRTVSPARPSRTEPPVATTQPAPIHSGSAAPAASAPGTVSRQSAPGSSTTTIGRREVNRTPPSAAPSTGTAASAPQPVTRDTAGRSPTVRQSPGTTTTAPAPAQSSVPRYIPSRPAQSETRSTTVPRTGDLPRQNFGTPLQGAPAQTYSAPSQNYQAPARTYSAPARTYSPPAQTYSAPAPTYSAPARTYSPPAPTYSAPAPTYNAPAPSTRSYSAPSYQAPARSVPSEAPRYSAPSSPAPSYHAAPSYSSPRSMDSGSSSYRSAPSAPPPSAPASRSAPSGSSSSGRSGGRDR